MKWRTPRPKCYGLTTPGLKLAMAVWWIAWANIVRLADPPEDLGFSLLIGGVVLPPFGFYLFNEWLSRRQRERDVARALTEVKRPLRNATQRDGRIVDFDPRFPTVQASGHLVSAIDPGRRSIGVIMSNIKDIDGQDMEEVGPIDGEIVDVSETALPGNRRWLWVLPLRPVDHQIQITVTLRGKDGKNLAVPFRFRAGDAAALGWRLTFEQWMRDDHATAAI